MNLVVNRDIENIEANDNEIGVINALIKEKNLNENLISIVIKFVRYLRGNNFVIPLTASIMFLEIIEGFSILRKKEFLYISKSIFCKTQMEYDSYEDLFAKFFFEKEVESLAILAEQEKKVLAEKYNNMISATNKEIEELEKKAREQERKALEEVLSAKYKVYREQGELLEDIKEETMKSFEDIKKEYIEETKNEDDYLDIAEALMLLKKDFLSKLSDNQKSLNFNDVKEDIQNIMLKNMEKNNDEGLNELLLSTASTICKIETEFNKKMKEIENDLSLSKEEKQKQLNELKINNRSELESYSLNIKMATGNHRDEFIGKGAVIELLKNTDRVVSGLNDEEYNSLLYYIKANAPKFRTKVGRSMKKAKVKQFDYKKTLQKSVRHNGIPIDLFYKKPVVKKFKLFCVLDISGSVSKYLKVLSSFLFELNSVFSGGIEVYGFVSDLIDFTEVFKSGSLEEATEATKGHRGYSNYYKCLQDFYDNCYDRIDKDSIILYFGDARNNKNAAGEEILHTISKRARYSVWINGEEKSKWNTGDSIMDVYSKNVNVTYEVNKINQLIHFLNDFSIRDTSIDSVI